MAEKIATFLQKHKKEVVLLDFNHFYNMSSENHAQCILMLQDIFGNKLCKFSEDIDEITLKYLWDKNFQVVAFYHDNHANGNQLFWPGESIPSPWPDVELTALLLDKLEKQYDEGRDMKKFHVTQGVLTPGRLMVATHFWSSLKTQCSDKCGAPFVSWLQGKSAGMYGINVCIIDFADEYNYIPSVLSLNQ